MGRDASRYLDEQMVELLYGSCPAPTPKSTFVYMYIRSAVALRRYDSGVSTALAESVRYYRMIMDRQHLMADIAQQDAAFVREYRLQLTELGRRVESGYIDTFTTAAPVMNTRGQTDYREMNTRGQTEYLVSRSGQPLDPNIQMNYEDGRYRAPLTSVMSATYGVSRSNQPAALANYNASRGSQPVMPAMAVDLLTGEDVSARSASAYASGARTTATTDPWGMTRGAAPAADTRALTPVESYNLRTRAALRDAEGRYTVYRQASTTYSRGPR